MPDVGEDGVGHDERGGAAEAREEAADEDGFDVFGFAGGDLQDDKEEDCNAEREAAAIELREGSEEAWAQ